MSTENYFDWVYQVVRQIPEGKVTSYGAIAHYLGLKSGSRMVGYAMNASHTLTDVPAHRVVNRNGVLTGKRFFGAGDEMKNLLEKEGIIVENDQIKDFQKHFWNPNLIEL